MFKIRVRDSSLEVFMVISWFRMNLCGFVICVAKLVDFRARSGGKTGCHCYLNGMTSVPRRISNVLARVTGGALSEFPILHHLHNGIWTWLLLMLDFADGVPQQLHSMYTQICPTWWERLILLMEEILQQLIASLSDYPMICRVFCTSQVVQEFFHQQY